MITPLRWYILAACLIGPLLAEQSTANEFLALPPISLEKKADVSIKIDGKLDDDVWSTLPAYDNLHTIVPDTLTPAPHSTEVRFFYTARGLYIGFMNHQPAESLVARLSSRDRFISRDQVSVTLDPSGEGLYGYWFGVNLGGSLSDGTLLPERQFNNQWDGAWRGASAVVEGGWSAEMFLPWSMMTMPNLEGETRRIGFYMSRFMSERSERWGWPALPPTISRFMSALQIFELENITPRKQFTFYPYAAAGYNAIDREDHYKAGFDIYWRPSSNMQLSATINPDFGNVESDDVDVNLTAFETFFPEKRPFFLEGQDIFNTTPRSRSRGRSTPTVLVNTRRIGSPPRELDVPGLEITELEEFQPTELEGAVKITGQKDNWRYGVFAAIEDDTKIEGTIDDVPVAFMQDGRDFGVARLLYESTSGSGRTGLGWITTMVAHPDEDAIVHGIDGHYLSQDGKWAFDGQMLYSNVGDTAGSGAFMDLAYTPRQGLKHRVSLDYFDDELDINDFGFLRRNDAIGASYRLEINESDMPTLRSRRTSIFLSQEYNTDGRVVRSGTFFNQEYEFNNNHFLFWELNYFPSRWDDINSDGNGAFRIYPRRQLGAFYETDSARPLRLGFGYFFTEELLGGYQHFFESEIVWRPSDRFAATISLAYRDRTDWLLHREDRDFTTFDARAWEPKLSMDFFLSAQQQFRVSAQWIGIKADESRRLEVPIGDGYLIEDPDPVTGSRDFSISNLIFQARYRWEIAPLSDLFVVYTRGSDLPNLPDDTFSTLLRKSWTDRAVDVFVVKLRYRLGS